MKKIVLMLALASLVTARPFEKLTPLAGVQPGKIGYRPSEVARDALLETFLIASQHIPAGQEVTYYYNRLSLDGQGKHVLVLLGGSYFAGSGGGTLLILSDAPQAPLGFRLLATHTLVSPPVLACTSRHQGWSDLTWPSRGGGLPASYTSVVFSNGTYPSDSRPVAPATKLNGTAYLAEVIGPKSGHRFVVGPEGCYPLPAED